MGKFTCASSGLCMSKDLFNNRKESIDFNCTSREGGPCQHDPCGKYGICYEGVGKYYCGCNPGWKGLTCESESKV